MTDKRLDGLRVAALATDGVEDSELSEPARALKEAGADVTLISIKPGTIAGKKGAAFSVDRTVDEVSADDYDALLLPGGVANPDKLRMNERAVAFVRDMVAAAKPIAAICHAPWMLVEADVLRGRRLTSYPSLKTDIRNAGGDWVDEEVVVDHGLVTSRRPDDIPAFNAKMLEEFAEGTHARREPPVATAPSRS
jgi:protease I